MIAIAFVLLLLPARPGSTELEALRDPSRDVREKAIAALAAKERDIDDLLLLLHEKDARVRRGVCAALAVRAEPVAIPALLLEGSPDAALACVRIVEQSRLDLPTIAALATPAMRAALRQAHAGTVNARLKPLRGSLGLARPQTHRAHIAGGVWSERILLGIARDPDQPPRKRAHALHAAQLLIGRALESDLVKLLDDPEEAVRSAALTLLWRLHTDRGNQELVKLLERADRYSNSNVSLLVSSVDQGGTPTPEGRQFLATRIRTGSAALAADAAAVLLKHERKVALELLTARVRDQIHRSDGPELALLFLRCGTPTPELRKLALRTKDPLSRLVTTQPAEKIPEALREFLDPRPGSSEWVRIRVVSTLLARHNLPWEDRLRYARGVLGSDVASWRAGGLHLLRGAPEEILRPLHPRLFLSLDDRSETVRVKAAILLMPEPRAQRVLWTALYDGDLRTAWSAAPALDAKLSRRTPVAERRRRARDALAALDRR